eukprot:CAMPEP_0174704688 /NCGR_PEP_ID=MMETSP1094-20130205/8184_1 /TAXON_ID=156173 /ORGANISM="Chrysochromulina brevifilum, Strain UTEX LB 985" /LENGTH=971 /DNA_ID=CAMNT_0015902771 /DNA_START=18 /DNA_END=2933 /DNA_ORIENTATION=-
MSDDDWPNEIVVEPSEVAVQPQLAVPSPLRHSLSDNSTTETKKNKPAPTAYDAEKKIARRQQIASMGPCCSSLIIIASIGVVIGTMISSLTEAVDSLASISSQFREASQKQVNVAIASAIAPNWRFTRGWYDLMELNVPHATPTVAGMLNYTALETHLALTRFPHTNRDAHLIRHVDGTEREYAGFVGMVSVLTDTNWEQEQRAHQQHPPTTSCANSWTAGFLRLPVAGPPTYILDRIIADPAYTGPPNTPGGVAGISRLFHPFVPSSPPPLIKDAIPTPPPLDCATLMDPLWSPFASPMNNAFLNFTWMGPYNPGIGWGNQFEGSLPIYDSSRTHIIGRFSSAVALASITESISRILSESSMFDNGFTSIFTPDVASLGPFGSVVIAQTNLNISGLATLATVRLTAQGLEAAAPVHAATPPGQSCAMCITPCLANPAFCELQGEPETACASDTCSILSLRMLCPAGALSSRPTPKGPEFACIINSEGAMAMASAAHQVKAAIGTSCPPERREFEFGGNIVDVTPFYAEDYGLPGLAPPGYWCQLTMIPRRNVYRSTDEAQENIAIVLSVTISGILVGVLMMLLALWVVNRARADLQRGRRLKEEQLVQQAVSGMEALTHPMVLVPAELFVGFGELPMHENLRDDRVGLITINNLQELRQLKHVKKRKVIFISHQWLSRSAPDPSNAHYRSMKSAVEQVATSANAPLDGYAVWCDYCSISQKHPKLQRLAIASLPMYAAYCDVFIAVAPVAMHHDYGCTLDLEGYCKRGFCRVEMLSKICGSGILNSYVMDGNHQLLRPFPLERLSYFVFEGEFTVESDKEELVVPALGLYSLIIRQKDQPHMKQVYELVQAHKARFFPPEWTPTFTNKSRASEKPKLTHRLKTLSKSIDLLQVTSRFTSASRATSPDRSSARVATVGPKRELFGTRLAELLEEYVEKKVARQQERRSATRRIMNQSSTTEATVAVTTAIG